MRLTRSIRAASLTALALSLGWQAPAYAQSANQAQVVSACGVPNSTYSAGSTKPTTQDTTGLTCINAGSLGTVTVSNPFNLEATQLLVKADLDSLVTAAANPVPVVGTDGTNKTSSTNPLDVIVRAGTATMGNVVPIAGTTGGATTYHVIAAASDNHAVIKNGAGTVYSITGTSIHSTYQYVRLYNAGTGFNGCNSATNIVGGWIIPGATTGAGGTFTIPVGVAFSTGISICITGAFSDTDTTNATASVLSVNVNYN